MAKAVLTANSPSAGYIAWSTFTIQYGNVVRVIPAGNSNLQWIYWLWNGGAPTTALQRSNTLPVGLTDDDLVLFVNRGGIPISAQSANVVEGSLIVNESIIAASIQAGTIDATRIAADTLTAREIKAGAVTASELAISSLGELAAVNGNMDDVDPATKIPAGWTAGYERTGTPVYTADTATPISGSTSTVITLPANAVEGMAARATPCLPGQKIVFSVAFRTSVTNVPITLRAYFGTADGFTAAQTVASVPLTPTNVAISDITTDGSGLVARDDIPSPLVGAGIAAMVEAWRTPVTTRLYVEGQITVPAGASWVRFMLCSGLPVGNGGSPAHAVTWDALLYAPVVTSARIADGAITARTIAANTITANEVSAEGLIGATIKTAGTGRRVEMDQTGLYLYDSAGMAVVKMPTNAELPVWIEGNLYAHSLTIADGQTIQGVTNELSTGAVQTLAAGVTAPGGPPAVALGWPAIQHPVIEDLSLLSATIVMGDGNYLSLRAGGDLVATTPAGVVTTFTGAQRLIPPADRYLVGGFTKIGADYWAYSVDTNSSYHVERYNGTTGAFVSSWAYNALWSVGAIGTDGTNVVLAEKTSATQLHVMVWNQAGVLQGSYTGTAPFDGHVTGVLVGSFDLGAPRYVIVSHSSSTVAQDLVAYSFSASGSTLTAQPNEHFPLPNSLARAFMWDGAKFLTLSDTHNVYAHSQNKWTTETSTWLASYAWNKIGGGQTTQSPREVFVMLKRATLYLTSEPIPPGGAVDSVRFFVGRGNTDPGRTGMWRDNADPVTADLRYMSWASRSFTTGTNPLATGTFPNATPAKIVSSAKRADGTTPMWSLSGDGAAALWGLTTAAEVTAITPVGSQSPGLYGQFRAVAGNYGFFLRNDGTDTGFLFTAQYDPLGIWSGTVPLVFNNATKVATFGAKVLAPNLGIKGDTTGPGGVVNCTATFTDVITATAAVINGQTYRITAFSYGTQITTAGGVSRTQIIDDQGGSRFIGYKNNPLLNEALMNTGVMFMTANSTRTATFKIQGAASAGSLSVSIGSCRLTIEAV